MTVAIVVGVLGALALVSIILALFLLLIKIRNRPATTGFNMGGADNKAYATWARMRSQRARTWLSVSAVACANSTSVAEAQPSPSHVV